MSSIDDKQNDFWRYFIQEQKSISSSMNCNPRSDYLLETFRNSPYHRRSYSPMINEIPARRNSYQLAIHTSKSDHCNHHGVFSSVSSSVSSLHHPHHHHPTTRSLYAVHQIGSHFPIDHLQRSLSQPAVRSPENDLLLENATYLLDSPVHALRPAHYKSRTTLPPTNPVSIRSSLAVPDSIGDSNYCSSTSPMSVTSAYRIVIVRSLAALFALASLFSTEVLQTSIHSSEQSFQSLLTFHLCASIGAFLLAAHSAQIHRTRHRWTISHVLVYDRCSQILIVLATMFTGVWVAMQFYHQYERLLLLSAAISGFSFSCMTVKTFEHLLQLSVSLPIGSLKKLSMRLNIFAFIYNSLCHLALTIGGIGLLAIILYQQHRREYILIASYPCLLMPCSQTVDQLDDRLPALIPSLQAIRVNLTMHLTDKKQEWQGEPVRYIFFVTLLILTIISLLPQAGVEWTTSILSMSRRLSVLYYSNEETKIERSMTVKRLVRCRHYLLGLFLGFQEGYLFGSLLKFDVTCLFGLRHTMEILIIYGLGATAASTCLSFVIKRVSMMTLMSLISLLHSGTLLFLFVTRSSSIVLPISGLLQKLILFALFGIVVGLWSTVTTHFLCKSSQFSSSSLFAQSFAIRCFGRLLSYTCTVVLCQLIGFYINLISVLVIFAFLLLCYCCCNEKKDDEGK